MILVDEAIWPAHGTVWAHLVSDTSLEELHEFAARLELPPRSFDLDHYDVPQARIGELVAAGAVQVGSRQLIRRLRESGLRVRGHQREAVAQHRRHLELRERWAALSVGVVRADAGAAWQARGAELLERWSQPHRHYHDTAHLHDVLLNLDTLHTAGEVVDTPVVLAAWFHDAVYEGRPGVDEHESAQLAEQVLSQAGAAPGVVAETSRLVRVTAGHASDPGDAAAAAIADADLAILGALPKRYAAYTQAVRREYAAVPPEVFRAGRAQVLSAFLDRDRLFVTTAAHQRWEAAARRNVAAELAELIG